jgi:hypothetical protein
MPEQKTETTDDVQNNNNHAYKHCLAVPLFPQTCNSHFAAFYIVVVGSLLYNTSSVTRLYSIDDSDK